LPNGERRMSEDCPYRTLSRRRPCHQPMANPLDKADLQPGLRSKL
jgi:hypothetical protein